MAEAEVDLETKPFSLHYTLSCGQVFRWEKPRECWYGIVGGNIVKIRQDGNILIFQTYPEDLGAKFVARYFRLNDDLPQILRDIGRDEYIERAIREFFGLRLTRQDPWECLISYICATYANIPRIKDMIQRLSKAFGMEIPFEGRVYYAFPTWESLAKATLKDLLDCKLGYRAKYVLRTTKKMKENRFGLENLRELSYDEGQRRLLHLYGVGPKVAECVLLFSQDKLEAFPVDIWVKRVIRDYYRHRLPQDIFLGGEGLSLKESRLIRAFGRRYFGAFAGYAQEYLYYYYRSRTFRRKSGMRVKRGN
jgi:N-glycosylase/DNA lyase